MNTIITLQDVSTIQVSAWNTFRCAYGESRREMISVAKTFAKFGAQIPSREKIAMRAMEILQREAEKMDVIRENEKKFKVFIKLFPDDIRENIERMTAEMREKMRATEDDLFLELTDANRSIMLYRYSGESIHIEVNMDGIDFGMNLGIQL